METVLGIDGTFTVAMRTRRFAARSAQGGISILFIHEEGLPYRPERGCAVWISGEATHDCIAGAPWRGREMFRAPSRIIRQLIFNTGPQSDYQRMRSGWSYYRNYDVGIAFWCTNYSDFAHRQLKRDLVDRRS